MKPMNASKLPRFWKLTNMSNNIFIPDDDSMITSEGFRKGKICYKINTSPYQTIVLTAKQTLIKKILSPNEDFDKKMLSSDEKIEYKRLYNNIYNTPKEKIIKECIIVFTDRQAAVGLKVIDEDIFLAFKSFKLKKIKAICKKNNVTINYDYRIVHALFIYEYLNENPSYGILEYIAEKFNKIRQKDKIFAEKIKLIFRIT